MKKKIKQCSGLESLHRLSAFDLKTKLKNALFAPKSSLKHGNIPTEVFDWLQLEPSASGSLVTAKMA
jgi:hypothetical protein